MIKASIIILTRNRYLLLDRCLNSIININKSNYEIIVIDNASDDQTETTLKKYKKKITVIRNKKNLGVAAGRNLGIKKASSEFLIFLDDDAFVKEDSFSKMINYMKKHPQVGIIGPKILYPSGRLQESAREFPNPISIIWRGTFLSKVFPNFFLYKKYLMQDFNHKKVIEVDWVLGACQIIRREVFKEIGLFDERYFFGYEDIDFCLNAKRAGRKVIYYPKARIYHNYIRESSKKFISRLKTEHIKSIIYYFWKNYAIKLGK